MYTLQSNEQEAIARNSGTNVTQFMQSAWAFHLCANYTSSDDIVTFKDFVSTPVTNVL
eukprot:CAMPEP_0202971874 /NCGR_PEP_ID=MMETSP1396-20130829/31785_1 /ASSEMBLY_ACC=CAM_ASM_000872 /TAXON_ID= /ORGANISM="Pseudokeronopsis sp., Strain Brazil" /LENGTH=57 /DNA_ID=CAMNT_0049701717 /DNA_START=1 /DNA_END=171 /DNA_ORIENTATION=-